MIAAVRSAKLKTAPRLLPLILLPWVIADTLRRMRDYPQFRRLRASLPPDFWRGSSPLRHYLRMIAQWQQSLAWIPGWGQKRPTAFAPLYFGGVDTLIWGLLVSLVLGYGVSRFTRPDEALRRKYFGE